MMAWGLLDEGDKSDSKTVVDSKTDDEDGDDDLEIVSPNHDFCLWRDDGIGDDMEVVCPTRYGFGLEIPVGS
ncbi:hypothetical protein Tco_0374540 [Tanacetum coccineum]